MRSLSLFDRSRLWKALQQPDFDQLLPLMAKLPLTMADQTALWRGRWNARWSRDWAELSVGFPYVALRTANALRDIFPDADAEMIGYWVRQRYQTMARYELHGQMAIAGRLAELQIELSPMRAMLKQREPGRGLVVIMSHFDSIFVGMTAIARCGVPVHLMTTRIIDHPQVHPSYTRFTRENYRAYERGFNGGRMMDASSAARDSFYKALRRGEIVVVVTDSPAVRPNTGTWVNWFGKRRKMSDGGLRMALDTDSELVGLMCRQQSPSTLSVTSCQVIQPDAGLGPENQAAREVAYAEPFRFIEQHIRADPGRWWSAHLLQDYVIDGTTISGNKAAAVPQQENKAIAD